MERYSHSLSTRLWRNKPTWSNIKLRSLSKFGSFGDSPVPPNKQRFVPTSGTYPLGFLVGSINVGIKADSLTRPDLILVASEKPSCGAAVFTKNEFPAASITVSKDILLRSKGHGLRGVIANAWCANLFTGQAGLEDATAMSREADKHLSSESNSGTVSPVMVMHTGIANERLPMKNIIDSMPKLCQRMGNSHKQWLEAARGICTSDTFPKVVSRTYTLPSSPDITFSIAGITKGAGMIHPNMATTLGIICTDAPITPRALQQLLSTAADKSYNCISIEGDTSTNDMVTMLANGAAGGATIDFDPSAISQSADFVAMQRTLTRFAVDMAKLVVRDGEGATKFITVRIRGSPSHAAAKHIASAVARSVLVKTGMYGKNPTWEGVVAALGYSLLDTRFEGEGVIVPESTSVSFMLPDDGGELNFFHRGVPVEVDQERIRQIMEREDVEVVLDLRDSGKGTSHDIKETVYWTCDLTHEFVTMNAA